MEVIADEGEQELSADNEHEEVALEGRPDGDVAPEDPGVRHLYNPAQPTEQERRLRELTHLPHPALAHRLCGRMCCRSPAPSARAAW